MGKWGGSAKGWWGKRDKSAVNDGFLVQTYIIVKRTKRGRGTETYFWKLS